VWNLGGSEVGSYLRLIDFYATQRKAPGPSRTCNENKEEEDDELTDPNGDIMAKVPQ
jgi:hypothetical protein